MRIAIAVGTVSGNAHLLADEIAGWLAARGHRGDILPDMAGPADLKRCDGLLVVTATTGHGELPATIAPFAQALAATRLDGFPVGVIGLGDSLYADTFSGGGKTMASLLAAAGAAALIPALEIDAGAEPVPEVPAAPWIAAWLDALEARHRDGWRRSA